MTQQQLETLVNRLETAVQRLEQLKLSGASSSGSSSASEGSEPASVSAFADYYNTYVQPFVETLKTLGAECTESAKQVSESFGEMKKLLVLAAKSKKPSDEEFGNILGGLGKSLTAVGDYRRKNNRSELYNHLYALEEGLNCLVWPTSPTPVSHVKEMVNAAQFYNNKILMTFKTSDKVELHRAFVNQFKSLIEELANYVKEYHMSGLSWNAKASQVASASLLNDSSSSAQPSTPQPTTSGPPGGVPPPPTKVIPVSQELVKSSMGGASSSGGQDAGALFAEISARKDNAASGLKHVTKDMKTKNQTDRPPAVVPGTVQPKSTVTPKTTAGVKQGTPKFERDGSGKKWQVEWQKGAHDLKITDTALNQSVYVFSCTDTMVEVSGKVNNIVLDKCTKTCVVFDSVVSGVELVNCKSCQIQIRGISPMISIDKTDGAIVYLSKESINARIVTAKSSEMNIVVPDETSEDEVVEIPLPEQFVHLYDEKTKKFTTEMMKHE